MLERYLSENFSGIIIDGHDFLTYSIEENINLLKEITIPSVIINGYFDNVDNVNLCYVNNNISSFIENVENFISLLWLFDLYYLTSYSIKKINGILTTKIGTVLIFLITVIDSFVINNNYEYLLYIYKRVPYILYILVIPILILANKKRVN